MKRLAFTMKLFAGKEVEYRKRHDEIWPQLVTLLKDHGISEYSIFLDDATLTLFGVLTIEDIRKFEQLPQAPLMQQWWQYMKDIMKTNADGSPVSVKLEEIFYLP